MGEFKPETIYVAVEYWDDDAGRALLGKHRATCVATTPMGSHYGQLEILDDPPEGRGRAWLSACYAPGVWRRVWEITEDEYNGTCLKPGAPS